MARYVLVADGIVGNVIEWDGNPEGDESGWAPPEGTIAVESDEAQNGWSYEGGTFAPPAPPVPPPPTVPAEVSPRQLQLALLAAGLLDKVEALVESDSTPRAARISWKAATVYRRDDAMLNEMAAHLTPPMSPAQIDQLFIAAGAIQ